MSKVRLVSVNFGSAKSGLATVGFTVYNKDGTVRSASSIVGVSELGTSTGIYFANPTLDDDFDGIILWTTGEATPRYGLEPTFGQLNAIQEGSDLIRIIWNSLKNQGDAYNKLLSAISKLKIPEIREYDKELKELMGLIREVKEKEYPKLQEIEKLIKTTDYTNEISVIKDSLSYLSKRIDRIPVQHKDYAPELLSITNNTKKVLDNLQNKASNIGELYFELNRLLKSINDTQEKLTVVNNNITNTVKPAKFLQEIYSILQQTDDLKKLMQEYQKKTKGLEYLGIR